MKVNIKDLKRVLAYLALLESVPLEEIEWIDGNSKIEVDKKEIEKFKFTGLNNKDFAIFNILNK